MKKIITTILLIAATFSANAGIVESADSAYINDDFDAAARLYMQALNELGPSAERYYNAGNAYYRAGKPGMAIANYERALRLAPGNSDIIDNLEFVNAKTVDRIDTPRSFMGSATDKVALSLGPNTWAWMGLVFFILVLAGVGTYFFASSVMARKIGFFGAGTMLVLSVIANYFGYRAADKASANNEAVIIQPIVDLSTSPRVPRDAGEIAMRLHEGTKVTIVDSIATNQEKWYDVKIDDSHRAWISGDAVEII